MMTGLLVGLARDVCRLWRYNYSLLLYDKRKKKEKTSQISNIGEGIRWEQTFFFQGVQKNLKGMLRRDGVKRSLKGWVGIVG